MILIVELIDWSKSCETFRSILPTIFSYRRDLSLNCHWCFIYFLIRLTVFKKRSKIYGPVAWHQLLYTVKLLTCTRTPCFVGTNYNQNWKLDITISEIFIIAFCCYILGVSKLFLISKHIKLCKNVICCTRNSSTNL